MRSPTSWTRLEPRTRDRELSEALRAPVRDPLWLLGRQWQLGEFAGEDAGTPVRTTMSIRHHHLTRYRLGDGAVERYQTGGPTPSPPLEALVERQQVRPPAAESLDEGRDIKLAAEAGQRFIALLADEGIGAEPTDFAESDLGEYTDVGVTDLLLDPDPSTLRGDPASERYLAVVAGRVLDGDALYRVVQKALPAASGSADPTVPLPEPTPGPVDDQAYRRAFERFRDWYADCYSEPEPSADGWDDDRLEHRFEVGVGDATDGFVFGAEEYRGGRLDWYAFDHEPTASLAVPPELLLESDVLRDLLERSGSLADLLDSPLPTDGGSDSIAADGDGVETSLEDATTDGGTTETTTTTEVTVDTTPTRLRYKGMPAPRWWELEDGAVNLDLIDAAPEDLSRLLLLEYGVLYGNDWFQLPINTPVGTFTTVEEMRVTDSFGTETVVGHTSEATTAETETDADTDESAPWRLFEFETSTGHGLLLPPVVAGLLESDPVEEVQFVRDELVNVAWALEEHVEGPLGRPIDRHELDQERDAERGDDQFGLPVASVADVEYTLATDVPDYWLPLLPVQGPDSQVELRLAELLDGSGRTSESWGRLLDADLSVPEEEIPRSGTAVRRSYQLARWVDGSTHLWSGRRTDPGRGEGTSGLRFDITADREGHSNGVSRAASASDDAPVAVVSLQSRPPMTVPDRLNEEYLVLQNVSGRPLNVTDWTLTDTANHSYTFGQRTLAPADIVVVRSGLGPTDDSVVHLDSPGPIWNDTADEVRLYDERGMLVLSQSYPDLSGVVPDSPVAVEPTHVDASGDDHDSLADEYISIQNTTDPDGGETVDLSGWVVRDIADHRYVFPDDSHSELAPGSRIRLRTGSGVDTDEDRYWGQSRAVWNNRDDAILLFDPDGRLMAGAVY
ncbi:lamin tail domain-containing protein [Salinigranum marinum]|uniref:lamin tail domain-containing protein n=1 Tax=Salinigranum marinum TaxID=1515595 RepID=UPI002989EF4A|nr:lamin tail domain-containing protein [Salinigranum marinum]